MDLDQNFCIQSLDFFCPACPGWMLLPEADGEGRPSHSLKLRENTDVSPERCSLVPDTLKTAQLLGSPLSKPQFPHLHNAGAPGTQQALRQLNQIPGWCVQWCFMQAMASLNHRCRIEAASHNRLWRAWDVTLGPSLVHWDFWRLLFKLQSFTLLISPYILLNKIWPIHFSIK